MSFARASALAALLWLTPTAALAGNEDYAAPYRLLAQANLTLDASLAASAYARDGALIFEIPGQPIEMYRGTDAIRTAYVRSFDQVDSGTPIEIEFRFEKPVRPSAHNGAYRLKAKVGGRDITAYGRFTVKLVWQDGAWRFGEDRGTPAAAADFEALHPG